MKHMKTDHPKGQCWHEDCTKKYVAQGRIVVQTALKNKCDLEIRACKEHFLMAWEQDFQVVIEKYREWKA